MIPKRAHLLLLVLHWVGVQGYSSGAPDTACNAMFPGHGSPAQTEASGVMMAMSSNTYSCGDVISGKCDDVRRI